MKKKKDPSSIDLLRGRINFQDDPPWFRLIVILIVIAFLVFVVLSLKKWGILTLGISSIPLGGIFGKGRSP